MSENNKLKTGYAIVDAVIDKLSQNKNENKEAIDELIKVVNKLASNEFELSTIGLMKNSIFGVREPSIIEMKLDREKELKEERINLIKDLEKILNKHGSSIYKTKQERIDEIQKELLEMNNSIQILRMSLNNFIYGSYEEPTEGHLKIMNKIEDLENRIKELSDELSQLQK